VQGGAVRDDGGGLNGVAHAGTPAPQSLARFDGYPTLVDQVAPRVSIVARQNQLARAGLLQFLGSTDTAGHRQVVIVGKIREVGGWMRVGIDANGSRAERRPGSQNDIPAPE